MFDKPKQGPKSRSSIILYHFDNDNGDVSSSGRDGTGKRAVPEYLWLQIGCGLERHQTVQRYATVEAYIHLAMANRQLVTVFHL